MIHPHATIYVCQISDCFEMHIDYNGGDLPGYSAPKHPVQSVYECRELCKKWPGCRFFTANGDKPTIEGFKTCYLKGGPETWNMMKYWHNSISGARDCGNIFYFGKVFIAIP